MRKYIFRYSWLGVVIITKRFFFGERCHHWPCVQRVIFLFAYQQYGFICNLVSISFVRFYASLRISLKNSQRFVWSTSTQEEEKQGDVLAASPAACCAPKTQTQVWKNTF